MKRGVIYVAYGTPAVNCVRLSIESVKQWEPNLSIVIITDQIFSGQKVIRIKRGDKGGRSVKTRIYDLAPTDWDQILYLDADTILLKKLDRFFAPLLIGWEMVFCRDELAPTVERCRLKNIVEMRTTVQEYGTGDLAQFAGGAISWVRCTNVERFFDRWHKEWQRWKYRDQGALVRALAQAPVKLWALPWTVNASKRSEAAEIWHRHGAARQRGAQ